MIRFVKKGEKKKTPKTQSRRIYALPPKWQGKRPKKVHEARLGPTFATINFHLMKAYDHVVALLEKKVRRVMWNHRIFTNFISYGDGRIGFICVDTGKLVSLHERFAFRYVLEIYETYDQLFGMSRLRWRCTPHGPVERDWDDEELQEQFDKDADPGQLGMFSFIDRFSPGKGLLDDK